MILNATTRCLAHQCDRPNACLRHTVIRQRNTPDDGNVVDNACRLHPLAWVPLVTITQPTLSFNEDHTRRAALDIGGST